MTNPAADFWGDPEELNQMFSYPEELMDQIFSPEPMFDAVFGDYPNVELQPTGRSDQFGVGKKLHGGV